MNQENRIPRKKVLFIITKATWGGAQRYVYDLVRSLPADRYTSVVAYGLPGRLSEEMKKSGMATHQLPSLVRDISLLSDIKGFFEIFSCIRTERPDIVHLNSSKAAALGAIAAWLNRTPRIVFTVHGWPFKEQRSLIISKVMLWMSWLTALLSDSVIVVSRTDIEIGEKMWFVGQKTRYVPIGIDVPAYLSREDALQLLWKKVPSDKVPRQATRVVTIAELTPNKGIRYAIEAMSALRGERGQHFIYLIIGDGEERESLEELVHTYHVEDLVFFLGFIPDASLLLRAFDAFLLPSIKEGMPYVLLEAGESGLPIVATDVVNPDIKERYRSVRIIRAENALAIADAIRNTTTNGVELPTITAASHFPLTDMVNKTVDAYENTPAT